ncbi:MAG: aspartate aminotransferase family protein, partial [Deltaproteobacteria bacterium]|nr:aspartate aminotransferase family protein [Deltaproteobacteria bacterium]
LDLSNNYTTIVLGHDNARVREAIVAQLARGTTLGGPTALEARLAGILCDRIPSFERVRFANSGTEANMNALRAARAYTGRTKVAKFEGGFHGSSDHVEVSISPPLAEAGPAERPIARPSSPGITAGVLQDVLVLPFNDLRATTALIEAHRAELAAVVVEPVMGVGGAIPPKSGFLEGLREATRRCGVVLVFDEVMTFRFSPGGSQAYYGVIPDMTVLGKAVGGGLPIGVFGGRRELMDLFDPSGGAPRVRHSGTFSGNPVVLAAGVAVLEQLTPEVYTHLNALGDTLRAECRGLFDRLGVAAQVTGAASMFALHLTAEEVVDYRSAATADKEAFHTLFLALLNEGIFLTSRGMGSLNAAMTGAEVQEFVTALERVLAL